MGIWQLNVFHRKNLAKPETQGTSPSCSHILANARMFRSCGDTLFNDLSMFLSALSCTYILSIDTKPLKTLCRKGFACMGTLSAMESLSDALNVLFFALLSGETLRYLHQGQCLISQNINQKLYKSFQINI